MLLLVLAALWLGLHLLPPSLSQPQTFCVTRDCLQKGDLGANSRRTAAESREREPIISNYTILGKRVEKIVLDSPLDGVHISIKTSEKLHESRLPLLALTWLQTVSRENVRLEY